MENLVMTRLYVMFQFFQAFSADMLLPLRSIKIVQIFFRHGESLRLRLLVPGTQHVIGAGADNETEIVTETTFCRIIFKTAAVVEDRQHDILDKIIQRVVINTAVFAVKTDQRRISFEETSPRFTRLIPEVFDNTVMRCKTHRFYLR